MADIIKQKQDLCELYINNHPGVNQVVKIAEPATNSVYDLTVNSSNDSGFTASSVINDEEISCTMLYDTGNYIVFHKHK